MQIVDGQPAAGVGVRRGFHAIFAIQHGKHDLADVGARSYQHALTQRLWQVLQEPVHDAKDFLGGALIVRDLHAQRAFAGDAADEEARRNVGGDAQLAGLEDDVALAAGFLQIVLGAIEAQTEQVATLVADLQHGVHDKLTNRLDPTRYGTAPEGEGLGVLIEVLTAFLQHGQSFGRRTEIFGGGRRGFGCGRHRCDFWRLFFTHRSTPGTFVSCRTAVVRASTADAAQGSYIPLKKSGATP